MRASHYNCTHTQFRFTVRLHVIIATLRHDNAAACRFSYITMLTTPLIAVTRCYAVTIVDSSSRHVIMPCHTIAALYVRRLYVQGRHHAADMIYAICRQRYYDYAVADCSPSFRQPLRQRLRCRFHAFLLTCAHEKIRGARRRKSEAQAR